MQQEVRLDERAAVLALDLGTTTGWAFNPSTGVIISGTWDLHPRKGETEGERYKKLQYALAEFHSAQYRESEVWLQTGKLEVVYEDVRRHAGTIAAHVYGGLLATLKMWCIEKGVTCTGVGVGQIKKFWTGKGNATKEQMIEEAVASGFDPVDDNEADALALLHKRLIEGPIIEAPKKRKAKTTAPERAGRLMAQRAAIALRPIIGVVSQSGGHQLGPAHQVPEQARAGGDGGSMHQHVDKADG